VGLQKQQLHQLPIGAPGPLIPGCVGWFFESVVRRILDSSCRLKAVVGFKFYSLGCTSYPGCLQLVILFISLRQTQSISNLLVKNGHDITVIIGKLVASIWICRPERVTIPDLVVLRRN
jgi:hypothetical protein